MKNGLLSFAIRPHAAKEKICETENSSVETSQTEMQIEKKQF